MAYFLVHSLDVSSYFGRLVLYMWAISGTKGSSGLGSVSKEQIDSKTCNPTPACVETQMLIAEWCEQAFELAVCRPCVDFEQYLRNG